MGSRHEISFGIDDNLRDRCDLGRDAYAVNGWLQCTSQMVLQFIEKVGIGEELCKPEVRVADAQQRKISRL